MMKKKDLIMSHRDNDNVSESVIKLSDIIEAILSGWKVILFVTTFVLVGALLFLLISKPTYKVNSLIQLDQGTKGISNQLTPIETMLSGELPAEGELEIIRSRSVVGKAVDDLKLDITAFAEPMFLVGSIIGSMNQGANKPVAPFLGISGYGWGGESIIITHLKVPRKLWGEKLSLEALGEGGYKLFDADGRFVLEGVVGKRVSEGKFTIQVDELLANPKTSFVVIRNSRYDTISDLQDKLEVEEVGNQSGIIKVGYSGNNVKTITGIVNLIVDEYVRKNIKRNAEEAERTLTFISAYQPESLKILKKAEKALSDFRSSQGTVAIEEEAKGLLDRTTDIQSQIEKLQLEQSDLRLKFSASHPSVKALEGKISQLNETLAKELKKIQSLPEVQRNLLSLTREVDVDTQMYSYLMDRTQELKLLEAGTVSDIRVIDRAERPFTPVFPVPSIVIAAALFLGFIIGITIVVIRISFGQAIKSAEDIERNLNTIVCAVVPHSASQEKRDKKDDKTLLAFAHPNNISIEGLRNFVVNIHFTLSDKSDQALVISGVSPGAGKSFVSANLAHVMSEGGKKVLLIDADLRKGHLHKLFNTELSPGLSEVLAGSAVFNSSVQQVSDNLSLLSSGEYPPNPIGLLMQPEFATLLEEWRLTYDFVIIDTPPVLSVADATIISKLVAATFFVVRAGQDSIEDIASAFKRYDNTDQTVEGCILNDFKPNALSSNGFSSYVYSTYGQDG